MVYKSIGNPNSKILDLSSGNYKPWRYRESNFDTPLLWVESVRSSYVHSIGIGGLMCEDSRRQDWIAMMAARSLKILPSTLARYVSL